MMVFLPILTMMQIPLLDLRRQNEPLKSQILSEIELLGDSQNWILGSAVEKFEHAVAQYSGAAHAIGVSSGTDALLVILMALGIGPGDAVITTPYTFFATAGCVARVGARPVFVDIDPETFNLSPKALKDALSRHDRIKAIIPVHLFGQCADMRAILQLATEAGVPVLEDAAQALGARHPLGAAGAMGEAGCFSFYPTKNLGGFGDAGMVVCRDGDLAARVKALRNHGMDTRYFHKWVGGNFRLDAIQAAVLNVKLPHLDQWIGHRQEKADFYRREFARQGLADVIQSPQAHSTAEGLRNGHIYNQFVIRVRRRDALRAHLSARGVGTEIYYPLPLHLQECFRELGYQPGDFPESENAARETLALPIFPELNVDEQNYVIEQIVSFFL